MEKAPRLISEGVNFSGEFPTFLLRSVLRVSVFTKKAKSQSDMINEAMDKKFPVSSFPVLFPTFEKLEETVVLFDEERVELMSKLYKNIQLCQQKALEPGLTQDALQTMNEIIPDIESFSTENSYMRVLHAWMIVETDNYKKPEEEKLSSEEVSEIFQFYTDLAQTKELVKSIDHFVSRVGDWFETGALGEGELSYNGKTYKF